MNQTWISRTSASTFNHWTISFANHHQLLSSPFIHFQALFHHNFLPIHETDYGGSGGDDFVSLFVGSPKFVGVVSGRFETQIQYDAELKNIQNILADESIYTFSVSNQKYDTGEHCYSLRKARKLCLVFW